MSRGRFFAARAASKKLWARYSLFLFGLAFSSAFRGHSFPPSLPSLPYVRTRILQLQLTSDVENFPGYAEAVSGPDLMEDLRKQAEVGYEEARRPKDEIAEREGGLRGGVRYLYLLALRGLIR